MSLVTISGGNGCGTEQIARLVAQQAGLELYDDRRLQQEALKQGFQSEDTRHLGEKAPGFLDALRGRQSNVYLDLLESMIYEVSRSGRGVDWSDPSLYDLIVNTEKFGVAGAAKLVLDALKSEAIQECSLHALESMERMALVKKVEAALAKEHFGLSLFQVEVPEKGVAEIYGYTSSVEIKQQMLETARRVPGVSRVVDDVGVLPSGAI